MGRIKFYKKIYQENVLFNITIILLSSHYIFYNCSYRGEILILLTLSLYFVVFFWAHSYFIPVRSYHLFISLFAIYCILSMVWAQDKSSPLAMGMAVLKVLFSFVPIYTYYYHHKDKQYRLFDIVQYTGYVVAIYIIISYGIGAVLNMLTTNTRISNEIVNSNSLGMLEAFSFILFFYKLLNKKNNRWGWLSIFSLLLIIISQSRKAIIILGIGIGAIIFKKLYSRNMVKTLFRILVAIIILFFIVKWLSTITYFGAIIVRLNAIISSITGQGKIDGSIYLRQGYQAVGIEQFLKTPILGIGIDNSHYLTVKYGHATYLHNNYVELLACGGIIGFSLYYGMWIYPAIKLLLKRKQYEENFLCILLIAILMIIQYAMVSYNDTLTYFFMMISYIYTSKAKPS